MNAHPFKLVLGMCVFPSLAKMIPPAEAAVVSVISRPILAQDVPLMNTAHPLLFVFKINAYMPAAVATLIVPILHLLSAPEIGVFVLNVMPTAIVEQTNTALGASAILHALLIPIVPTTSTDPSAI
jgi:hypothetical protein